MEALDAYPHDLPKVIEALDYALSYDSENTFALCLKGQFYSEQLSQYETAKDYFARSLAIDVNNLKIYSPYIVALTYNSDYEEAGKLIEFALTIKGIDKGIIYYRQIILNEHRMLFKQALKSLKKCRMHAFNPYFIKHLDEVKERIEGKMKEKKKKVKKVISN
jgi:tetratricopeptide (TPR) repeat protein